MTTSNKIIADGLIRFHMAQVAAPLVPRFTVGGTYHDAHDGPKGGVMLVEA